MTAAYAFAEKHANEKMTTEECAQKFNTPSDCTNLPDVRRYIMFKTFETFDKGFYLTDDGKEVQVDQALVLESVKNTAQINFSDIMSEVKEKVVTKSECTPVTVVSLDTVMGAKTLIEKGLKPALLNFANAHMPAGHYYYATGTQEENLCLRY
jgi:uncharacterized protein (TIGR02452 family)